MDSIEFRLVDVGSVEGGGTATATGVEPVIGGIGLMRRLEAVDVGAAPVRAADALWPGRLIWLGDPPPGRVPLATCVCGLWECGGVTAEITLDGRRARWSELTEVPSGAPTTIGPFAFRRAAYEAALTRVAEESHRSDGRAR